MTFTVRELVLDDLNDAELAPVVELANTCSHEERARSVDLTVDDFRMFAARPGMVQRRFSVLDDEGAMVGLGETRYDDDGSNPDKLGCRINVSPDQRRSGAGTLLLNRVVEIAIELGRSKLSSSHLDTVPAGAAFSDAVGAKPVLEMHMNVLRIADLDTALMRQWAEGGPKRAPGYQLTVYEGRWPDEIVEASTRLYHIIDRDSPQAEGHEPRKWTTEIISGFQDVLSRGSDSIMAMVFDEATGTAVGMSHLVRHHSDPTTWHVFVTMVDPEHRGRSLGKWVKGAANLAALESWKGGIYQETMNAFSNDAMLAINNAMGFEHDFTVTEVEVDVATASDFVATRVDLNQPSSATQGSRLR